MDVQKAQNKNVLPPVIFYMAATAGLFILDKISPGGPCTPGLGFFAFFLMLPIAAVLFLRAIVLWLQKKGNYGSIAFVHLLALACLVIFMALND